MPIVNGYDKTIGKPYYQYGNQKKYYYIAKSKRSRGSTTYTFNYFVSSS